MIGFIGGTGFYEAEAEPKARHKPETPFGEPSDEILEFEGFFFLPRHGRGHRYPAHRVPYKANLWALKELGAEAVVGIATVGSMDPDLPPGKFMLPTGLIDFSGIETFHDSPAVHVDFSEPFDGRLRGVLERALGEVGLPFRSWGTYAATRGPRFESPQEIIFLKSLGAHVVGMTVAKEAALARELELPYAAAVVVVNWAAGIGGALSVDEMREVLKALRGKIWEAMLKVAAWLG